MAEMAVDVESAVQQITEAEIDTEIAPLTSPSQATSSPSQATWRQGTKYFFLIRGNNAFITQRDLTERQQQDIAYPQWWAGRRASYLVKQKHPEVIGDDAPNKYPEEYFSYFRDEIGKIGWDTSQFVAQESHYKNSENRVPDFIANQLANLGSSEAVKDATKVLTEWAEQGKPSAEWFTKKDSDHEVVGKAYGDGYLDKNVLRFNGAFFKLTGEMTAKNFLIINIKDTDIELWTYKGWFRCISGKQLPDKIHNLLEDRLGGSPEDIENTPI